MTKEKTNYQYSVEQKKKTRKKPDFVTVFLYLLVGKPYCGNVIIMQENGIKREFSKDFCLVAGVFEWKAQFSVLLIFCLRPLIFRALNRHTQKEVQNHNHAYLLGHFDLPCKCVGPSFSSYNKQNKRRNFTANFFLFGLACGNVVILIPLLIRDCPYLSSCAFSSNKLRDKPIFTRDNLPFFFFFFLAASQSFSPRIRVFFSLSMVPFLSQLLSLLLPENYLCKIDIRIETHEMLNCSSLSHAQELKKKEQKNDWINNW